MTFVSSSMAAELDNERTAVRILFKMDSNLSCFFELYEIEDHASPLPIDKAYTEEVSHSNILIVILGTELRKAVVEEFNTAIQYGLNIFCYIKKGTPKTTELDKFIEGTAYSVHCGSFYTSDELVTKICNDLINDVTKSYIQKINLDKTQNRDEYFTKVTLSPTNEYRYFPVDTLIEESKREEIASLDKNQLISLAITTEEQYGDYRSALLLLEIGLLREPNDWMLHNNRGVILDKMGLLEASLYSYKRVLKCKSDSDTALYNVGNILMDLGRMQEAITYYERCLKISPEKTAALNSLAVCNLRINRIKEALNCSEKAITKTDDIIVKANYALILSANEKYMQALQICDELTSSPYYQSYTRSQIYYGLKEYEKSMIEIESILQMGALDYSLAIRKFYCLSALNRIDEARKWIDIIEDNYPFRSQDYNDIGFELMDKYHLYEESARLFHKSLDLNSKEMIAWNNLQSCLGAIGDFEGVLLASEGALDTNPFDQKSIKNKMISLTTLGRVDEAISFAVKKGLALFQNEELFEAFDQNFKSSLDKQGVDIKELNAFFRKLSTLNLGSNQ